MEWVPNNTSNVGPVRPGNNEFSTTNLGGRRRKSRKTKKAGRRRRRTAKRGGGSVATVGYSFTGTGDRGLANVSAYNSNPMPPGGYMSNPQA